MLKQIHGLLFDHEDPARRPRHRPRFGVGICSIVECRSKKFYGTEVRFKTEPNRSPAPLIRRERALATHFDVPIPSASSKPRPLTSISLSSLYLPFPCCFRTTFLLVSNFLEGGGKKITIRCGRLCGALLVVTPFGSISLSQG